MKASAVGLARPRPFRVGARFDIEGFFEFGGPKGQKQPHYFTARDGRLMAFAGLWASWKGPAAEPLLSYAFATCEPNAVMAPIHNRMPVMLYEKAQWDRWLDRNAEPTELAGDLLKPAPDDLLVEHKVTRDLLKLTEPGPEVLESIS